MLKCRVEKKKLVIIDLFMQLVKKLQQQKFLFPTDYDKYWTGKVKSSSGKHYGLAAWLGSEEYNLILHEDDSCKVGEKILKIVFWNNKTGGKRVAGKFVEADGTWWVGRENRFASKKYHHKFSDLKYREEDGVYLIGRVDDASSLVREICDFHEACEKRDFNENTPRSIVKCPKSTQVKLENASDYKGYDTGVDKEVTRSSAKAKKEHSEIVLALKAYVESQGAELYTVGHITKPDLIVEFEGKHFLFEVKPDANSQSLLTAIGQLITYAYDYRAAQPRMVIVFAGSSRTKLSKTAELALLVAQSVNIEVAPCKKASSQQFDFSQLDRIFSS